MFMMYKEKNTFFVGLEKDPAGVVCSVHLIACVCFYVRMPSLSES